MSSDEEDYRYGSQGMQSSSHKTECHNCGSTSMVTNEEGSMICEDCGVVRVATQEVVEDHEKYMNQVDFARPFCKLVQCPWFVTCTGLADSCLMVLFHRVAASTCVP
jgi:hypothetical protein